MVGLSYLSCFIRVAGGWLYTGILSDRVTIWLARRNYGVMEAEIRLWLFALNVILGPVQ